MDRLSRVWELLYNPLQPINSQPRRVAECRRPDHGRPPHAARHGNLSKVGPRPHDREHGRVAPLEHLAQALSDVMDFEGDCELQFSRRGAA